VCIYGSGQPYIWPYVWWFPCQKYRIYTVYLGLARTVYTHRIWPYVWWFPSWKYRLCTVCTYKCIILANPRYNWRTLPSSIPYRRLHSTVLGLVRTVYTHRIWPYIWWILCQKYHIYCIHRRCVVLANPIYYCTPGTQITGLSLKIPGEPCPPLFTFLTPAQHTAPPYPSCFVQLCKNVIGRSFLILFYLVL